MSDHLPECDWSKDDGECRVHEGWDESVYDSHRDRADNGVCSRCQAVCICDRLRACEARVRVSEAKAWAWPDERNAYELGIKAAREAVDRAPVLAVTDGVEEAFILRVDAALAAIDALKATP